MTVPAHISQAITRLVKPTSTKSNLRETLEAHADTICSEHNRMLKAMIHYIDTGEVQTQQIKVWVAEFNRNDAQACRTMRGVLEGAMLTAPRFQGTSDEKALEAYGRLLLNLYNLEVIGQPAIA